MKRVLTGDAALRREERLQQREDRLSTKNADLKAEIERLRHHLENMIEIAVEYMPENRPSIPHDYEPYDQYLADIAAARAELQPKEGGDERGY